MDKSSASRILAGTPRSGLDQHLNESRGRHPEQAEPQETAELVHARIAQASTTPGRTHRKPDLVAGSRSIYPLQHEFKTERQLELANHHDRRLVSTQRDQITAADFALDRKAERFEIALHRRIKRRLRSFRVALGLAGHPSALPRFGKRRVIWLLCDWSMLFAPTTFPFLTVRQLLSASLTMLMRSAGSAPNRAGSAIAS